jgi:hypothetical protein
MNSVERALHTLRVQTRFEIAQAAAGVANAVETTRGAQRQVEVQTDRCQHLVRELRRSVEQPTLDPMQRTLLQRLYRAERQGLDRWHGQHHHAQRIEDERREALAHVRHRDSSLQRALKREQRLQAVEAQRRSLVEADDLWLQRTTRSGA